MRQIHGSTHPLDGQGCVEVLAPLKPEAPGGGEGVAVQANLTLGHCGDHVSGQVRWPGASTPPPPWCGPASGAEVGIQV